MGGFISLEITVWSVRGLSGDEDYLEDNDRGVLLLVACMED